MPGAGAKYGLWAVLTARGYGCCTFHMTSTGKGGGTYVYLRDGLPGGRDATRTVFPPGKLVPGRQEAFDRPPGWPARVASAPTGSDGCPSIRRTPTRPDQ